MPTRPETDPDEVDVRLDQVLHTLGDTLDYEYDFGDSWRHGIEVEKITPGHRGTLHRCPTGLPA